MDKLTDELHKNINLENVEKIKELIKNGANVNSYHIFGLTPLTKACYINNLDIVKYLVENGADINLHDKYGSTPLITACDRNNLGIVKYLVGNGANINLHAIYTSFTPLITACDKNNLDIVKYLVENDAYINLHDKHGKTPLFYACDKIRPNKDIIEFLILNGADYEKSIICIKKLFNKNKLTEIIRIGDEKNIEKISTIKSAKKEKPDFGYRKNIKKSRIKKSRRKKSRSKYIRKSNNKYRRK